MYWLIKPYTEDSKNSTRKAQEQKEERRKKEQKKKNKLWGLQREKKKKEEKEVTWIHYQRCGRATISSLNNFICCVAFKRCRSKHVNGVCPLPSTTSKGALSIHRERANSVAPLLHARCIAVAPPNKNDCTRKGWRCWKQTWVSKADQKEENTIGQRRENKNVLTSCCFSL